ncbi:LysR family transcriptional regulator [Nonomuraea sp. MCN248]|uniref:LysR family transcriptional regulator n=1 Tax=Nonomuraea corallina TaxID=2989783 RepID=A0ABT4SPM3_9ACTN|nr:LysR family transcriptional regulator [Nonomuraea corallina]MDA0638900.1 LysR family transcriptional regulator [Nonomuraea corallina]
MLDTNAFDTATLRLFDEVARSGSFTAAAELLGYTQSAVSRRVAALERAAGGPLFERLPRGVRLTSAGHLLHRHAADVLDRLDRAGEELAALHRGSGGTLRVGSFATANADLLPATLRRFAGRRPAVELRVTEGLSPHLVERLHAGALDLAVISDYLITPPGDLRLVPLLEDRLLVALPRDHRLAGEDDVDLRDLAQERWIEAAPRGQPTLLLAACAAAGFTPRGGLRVAEWSGKFGFVAAGLGVTLVPALAARAVPSSIVLRGLRGQLPTRTVYAILPEPALPAATELAGMLGEWQACTTVTRM